METSLHRQLKQLYACQGARLEAPLDGYRIDVARRNELVEIQHGSLAAIRQKVQRLLISHRVLVVKPVVVRRRLIKQNAKGGRVLTRRLSPKRGKLIDLFDELIYFTRVFPHPRLSLEVLLVDIEEWRYPGHGRRRWRRENDHLIEDQKLIAVHETIRLRTAADLARLVPVSLPTPFHSGHLAEALGVKRWIAQRIAYCYRKMGTADQVGKAGNTLLYEFSKGKRREGKRHKATGKKVA